MMDPSFITYRLATSYLKDKIAAASISLPQVGIICGSGLSELSDALEGATLAVPYGDIPGFPEHCTVAGHKGEVVFGVLGGVPAMCFRGRFHSYEGHDLKTVVLPVHVMRCLQIKVVIVTNAAGGLNPEYNVGDVVIVTDHFALPSLSGKNSLVGPNDDSLGPRFPPTSNAYPDILRQAAAQAAEHLTFDFVKTNGACYCFVSGPMYESKAECRFLRSIGGDTVGMSTVPEIIAAHHCGMKVLCLSLVTNKVIIGGDEGPAASHAEVLEAVGVRAIQMQSLVKEILIVLNNNVLPTLEDLPPIDLKITPQSLGKSGFFGIPIHCILTTGLVMLSVTAILGTKLIKVKS
jgi:purine-nucleoside phosphorylase